MAILFFCETADGFVKHVHEQSEPPPETREKIIQGCLSDRAIVKCYEVVADQVPAALDHLVTQGTWDQALRDLIYQQYSARHQADELAGRLPKPKEETHG